MKTVIALLAATPLAATAAPFDLVTSVIGDERPESVTPALLSAGMPVVLNAWEQGSVMLAERDVLGAEAAMPRLTVPIRSKMMPAPAMSPLDLPAVLPLDAFDSMEMPVGGFNALPTPGSVALLGVGGLGFISRRA